MEPDLALAFVDDMLVQNPKLAAGVRKKGERDQKPYLDWLKAICGTWTVYIRYSSYTTAMGDSKTC